MLKKLVIVAVLAMVAAGLGGCFTLDPQHSAAHFRSWYQDVKDLHVLTDKYFWNYDANDPFEEF
jgi:hypothetical protein